MKKILIVLLIGFAFESYAQTSNSEMAVSKGSLSGAKASSLSSPNTSENLSTQIEEGKKRFETTFIFEGSAGVADLKESRSKAMIDSLNEAGIAYKISEKYRVELRHVYKVRVVSDREQLKTEAGEHTVIDPVTHQPLRDDNGNVVTESDYKFKSPYEMMDPTIHLDYTSEFTPWGAKPLSIKNRYSVPISEMSKEAKSQGVIRTETTLSWDLNPKVSIDYLIQARLYLHSSADADGAAIKDPTLGSDSTLRYVTGPTLTYNFNDNFNVYYNPFLDLLTTGFQRGDFSHADKRNQMFHDVGLNLIYGPLTINPYWETFAVQSNGSRSYEGVGADSHSTYNLSVTAVF